MTREDAILGDVRRVLGPDCNVIEQRRYLGDLLGERWQGLIFVLAKERLRVLGAMTKQSVSSFTKMRARLAAVAKE